MRREEFDSLINRNEYMGVAQLASVPHLGCGGRGFESHHPYIRKLTATVNTLVDTLVRIQYCRFFGN